MDQPVVVARTYLEYNRLVALFRRVGVPHIAVEINGLTAIQDQGIVKLGDNLATEPKVAMLKQRKVVTSMQRDCGVPGADLRADVLICSGCLNELSLRPARRVHLGRSLTEERAAYLNLSVERRPPLDELPPDD